MTAVTCTACGAPLVAAARFCERCGAEAGTDRGAETCEGCGGAVGADGFCARCGLPRPEPIAVEDRGDMAYATHRGHRHVRNEDAVAVATTAEGWTVLVVADGVSASPNPHRAAEAATTAAAGALAGRPFTSPEDLIAAVAAARAAVCRVPAVADPLWPDDDGHPACTIAVAVVTDDRAHVACVGDTRAYLLTRNAANEADPSWREVLLTSDDSLAAQAVRAGEDPAAALARPDAHVITAWLGADMPEGDPPPASHAVAPGDLVLLCSDGLWNYAPAAGLIAERVDAALASAPGTGPDEPRPLGAACDALVAWALGQGGADNVSVALAEVASRPPTGDRERPDAPAGRRIGDGVEPMASAPAGGAPGPRQDRQAEPSPTDTTEPEREEEGR